MTENHTKQPGPEQSGSEQPGQTALIHLYRAEIGRMTLYRVRLDTTTNWAIGMNAAALSFAFGSPDYRSVIFLLALPVTLLFLAMESRRYLSYALIKLRVRLLEAGFYAEQFGRGGADDWRQELAESLATPRPGISYMQAVSVRLRRVYLWVLLLDYASWLYSTQEHGEGIAGARMGTLPGWLMLVLLTVLVGGALVLSLAYMEPEEG